ncbi:hypothetical protein C8Q76DRAFT_691242 [Earliella scabrosa]|nr:hypothetical protein C8Q76DRAFT_691242 [Earliella scabrosa]
MKLRVPPEVLIMIFKNLRQKSLATIARCSRACISSFAAFLRRNNHVFERHSWTSLAIKSEIVGKDDGPELTYILETASTVGHIKHFLITNFETLLEDHPGAHDAILAMNQITEMVLLQVLYESPRDHQLALQSAWMHPIAFVHRWSTLRELIIYGTDSNVELRAQHLLQRHILPQVQILRFRSEAVCLCPEIWVAACSNLQELHLPDEPQRYDYETSLECRNANLGILWPQSLHHVSGQLEDVFELGMTGRLGELDMTVGEDAPTWSHKLYDVLCGIRVGSLTLRLHIPPRLGALQLEFEHIVHKALLPESITMYIKRFHLIHLLDLLKKVPSIDAVLVVIDKETRTTRGYFEDIPDNDGGGDDERDDIGGGGGGVEGRYGGDGDVRGLDEDGDGDIRGDLNAAAAGLLSSYPLPSSLDLESPVKMTTRCLDGHFDIQPTEMPVPGASFRIVRLQ